MNNLNKHNLKGFLLTIFGAIAWGFSGTCGQYLMNTKNLDSSYITNIRLLFAGFILILFSIFKNKNKTFEIFKNKKDTITLFIFAIFGMLTCQTSYLKAIYYTNAPTATVLQFLSSVFIVIGICFIEKRLPKKVEVFAVVIAIFGTFTLATHFNLNSLVITPIGFLWGIISAFAVVLYSILPLKILKKYSSVIVTGFGMLIGGILLSIILKPWNIKIDFDILTFFALFSMVIVGTVLAFTSFLAGISIIGPVKGSLIAGLEAISSLFFSIILLKESFEFFDLLGMSLILIAVTSLSLKKE